MFLRFLVSLLVVHGFEHERRTFQFELKARSGTRLHTRVVLPPKRARACADQFATIIDRSPYGYQHLEEIADLWLPAGFATGGQDMSGTEKSGGNFTIWKSDADDG